MPTATTALDAEAEWLLPPQHAPERCDSLDQVLTHLATLYVPVCLVKAPFGAAGQGQLRLMGPPDTAQMRWLARRIKQEGSVVVEPQLDRLADLSFHFDMTPQDGLALKGIRRFITDPNGRFRGVVLSRYGFGLRSDCARFLHGAGRDPDRIRRVVEALRLALERRLRAAEYSGPLGVDAFIYQAPTGELRLQPCVEINPRWTMGRIGLRIGRRISSTKVAVWLQLRMDDFGGRDQMMGWLAKQPVEFDRFGLLSGGVLPTNDPERAEEWLTCVLTGASWRALRDTVQPFGDPLATFS